ncbi:MAG: hypothetical protein J7501_13495 [Bdellovibrio sp.]|nr:hypothetical protein [Bdellovibrio sp.]
MRFIVAIGLAFCFATQAPAQTKKLNTQLYEKEEAVEKTSSFTGKVRVVRDISDDVEVFFDSDKATGAYTLPHGAKDYATMLKHLEESRGADGGQVTITADSEKRIKSVAPSSLGKSHKNSGDDWKVVIPDF